MTSAELEQDWELARKESRDLRLMLDTCQSASVSREREIERLREERASDKPLNMALEMATHNRKRAEVLEAELGRVNQEWQMVAIALGEERERVKALEAALRAVRDFEPVTNGNYAVMEAIPAMRKIAITALGSVPETPVNCNCPNGSYSKKHRDDCPLKIKGEQG